MRIALVSTYYTPTIGGVEKVIEELAVRYVKQGHKVDVFCSDFDKHKRIKKKFEVIDGVRVHRSRYWFKLSINFNIAPGTTWKLLWHKFDVVHSHVSAHDYVLGAGLVAWLKGKPHVHTTHCPWTDKFRSLPLRIMLFFSDNIFNYFSFFFCTKVIAITPWEIPILKRWMKRKKIETVPNGMDKLFFTKVKNNSFKKELGIPAKDKVVLFFGRYHPTKSPHHLAYVAKEVVQERKNIHFVFIAADEGLKTKVEHILEGVERTQVLGPIYDRKKVCAMYQASDVYVLPSYREGLPLTMFEAMASGCPVVATPVNGVPYEMKDGVHGFLFEWGNLKAMKEAILKILDDPKLAKKFSQNNLEKAKGYTWDKITEQTLDVYRKAMRK